ncbi:HD domain-containing protein [Aliikangiella marina]|uniref:HD domain-containing protein n=1 Tax=Aliikangiella marina TaxID=1712262 RepID=A0A545T753_9GAMM|nr:HD domain-containing protein [Aliikangiella marina]TQV73002.1 HD domain-containing protein [Aliikangiella marina]
MPENISGNLERAIQFIIEIEQLKDVHRKTRPVGLERYENSAEHSWHVCISALMLKDFADEPVDICRVIKMLLIHDLGEIDAGDTIIYQSETEENKLAERAGVARLLAFLSDQQAKDYLALWDEFEAGQTIDAQYAKAIDRVPPLLHNLHGNHHSWVENKVTESQVIAINSRIGKASKPIWQRLQQQISQAFRTDPQLQK